MMYAGLNRTQNVALSAILLVLFSSIFSATMLNAQNNSLDGKQVFAGSILLQRIDKSKSNAAVYGIYELQDSWAKPIRTSKVDFDPSLITGEILAFYPEKHLIIFSPHFLNNISNASIIALPLPGSTIIDPDYQIRSPCISPDGQRLVFVASGGNDLPLKVFIYEISSGRTIMLYSGSSAKYDVGVLREKIDDPTWIDSRTLIFAHHEGLPLSFRPGSREDPSTLNNVTVMTIDGIKILSSESDSNMTYRAVNGTVVRAYSDPKVVADAWLDGSELSRGILKLNPFAGNINELWSGPAISSISKDGNSILVFGESKWTKMEIRSGKKELLGTIYQPYVNHIPNHFEKSCLWSPDKNRAAFMVEDRNGVVSLLIIPLSKSIGKMIFSEENPLVDWILLDWRQTSDDKVVK